MSFPQGMASVLVVTASLLVSGCMFNDGREGVRGTVTLDGEPLESGSISFRPAPGNSASSAGGRIARGRYEIAADRGLLPGEYLVTIQATRKTGKQIEDPQKGLIDELAEVEFAEAGQLRATVAAQGENSFDFAVTSRTR